MMPVHCSAELETCLNRVVDRLAKAVGQEVRKALEDSRPHIVQTVPQMYEGVWPGMPVYVADQPFGPNTCIAQGKPGWGA